MRKICTSCGENKLLEKFYKHVKHKDGYRTSCKSCCEIYSRKRYSDLKQSGQKWIKNRKDTSRKTYLKSKFGLSLKDYDDLLQKQNNKCSICLVDQNNTDKLFHIDHAHTDSPYIPKNTIRGLLCDDCNRNLISNRTDPEIFIRASEYLKHDSGIRMPIKE